MLLLLFLNVVDVFAMAKQKYGSTYPLSLDYYDGDLPAGDPVNVNYGVTDFWWEDSTTSWRPWWEKMNMTKPELGRTYPVTTTTIETTETSNATSETVTQAETTSLNPEKTSPDINITTELVSTIPGAEESTITDTTLPLPVVYDPDLVAQLRYQQGLDAAAAATPRQMLVSNNALQNYDYYGELHDDIPPNVRGPEYPGLSQDIPVILNGTDKNTNKRLPAIPGWRLQFPDRSFKDKITDETPKTEKTEKTTFEVNYADYLNLVNDGMKVGSLSAERIGGSLQPGPNGFETKDLKATVSRDFNNLRDYPGFHDIAYIPDAIEDVLSTHSPLPFTFDEIMTGKDFMAQFSRAGPEGMLMPATNLKVVKAMSPTYTVPHEEPTGTPITSTTEPTTTTGFTAEPTTTIGFSSTYTVPQEQPTGTPITSATEPTTTTELTTEPTTTIGFSSTTEPMTTLSVTSTTQPSTIGSLNPGSPSTYKQTTYEVDWDILNTHEHTWVTDYDSIQEITTVPSTTPVNLLIEKIKKEMELRQVGYFSVCLEMFFKIFSEKENTALKALLKGGSHALQHINKNNELKNFGPPVWPGVELAFLQMRLAPIEAVKRRASKIYQYYTSGIDFDVKEMHARIDNFYYNKDGNDLMQAIAEFNEFPGVNREMNENMVMEHLFRATLAPYLRDPNNHKIKEMVKELNDKLFLARKGINRGDARRNTQGNYKYTTTTKKNFKNKFANNENNVKTSKYNNNADDSNGTPEIPHNNFDGYESYNAVELKDEINETKTFYDSYEDIQTEKNKSVVVDGDYNENFKKTKEYDNGGYFRMSKIKVIGPGIVHIRTRTTDTGEKEKASKKIKCYGDECAATDTNAVPTKASKNKYGLNEDSYRNDESKVRLLKDSSDKIRVQIRHLPQTEMGLTVKHKITGATILYDHNKYINKNPKKFTKRYNTAKKEFTSSNNDYDYRPLKDNNEENTHHTTRARNGEAKKFYLEIIKFNKSVPKHVKYGNEEPKQYPESYKNAKKETKNSLKDEDNRLSKDLKVNTNHKYYAKNGKTSDKKFYLEIFKYNKSDLKTYDKNDSQIGSVNSKDKINRKTEYISGTYREGPILQTKETKSKNIRITKATSKISDLSHKTIMETYDYETYDDKTESNLNGKSELYMNQDDGYDTFANRVNRKKIKYSINTLRRHEPSNKNVKRSAFQNSVKAKDYIKELRIRRTTKGKEYYRELKHYDTTTTSNLKKTFSHKNINKKYYLKTKNHKIWSSSEKVDQNRIILETSIHITYNSTENEVPRYENKKFLEDWNTPRLKNSKENVNKLEKEVKKNHQETNLEQRDTQFNSKESKTVKNTKNPGYSYTHLSERVLQNSFKQKQNPDAKNNEIHHNFSQSPKHQNVNSKAPDLKQKKNKTKYNFKRSEKNKTKSHNENNKKIWPHSISLYIVKDDASYLNERFLDFNRDNAQTKKKIILRNLGKNVNVLRDESSYSDYEEVLKSKLQDNLLHGGRNFTDTLHKYEKNNVIRDISTYSDEEETLKKNIYKLFT